MQHIKTTFECSLDSEVRRIFHACMNTASGFYANNNFYLLPKLENVASAIEVALPDLGYSDFPDYWSICSKIKYQLPITVPDDIYDFLEKRVKTSGSYSKVYIDKVSREWQDKETRFHTFVKTLVPFVATRLRSVHIYVTRFGSISSYYLSESKLHIYLRHDASISHIAEVYLTALIQGSHSYQSLIWYERERFVDNLMMSEPLKALFPVYAPTTMPKRQENIRLRKSSMEYQNRLGVSTDTSNIRILGHNIYISGKNIAKNITSTQSLLLKLFITKRKEIVSFDEVMDTVWGEYSETTSWAMSQAIKRLRETLETYGIPKSRLTTFRGRGYMLDI